MGLVTTRALQLSAGDVKAPKAEGYGARIGDLWVRLAVNPDQPLRYFTKDSLAPRLDQKGQTGANVLDIGYSWARTELDGGQGLDWDPRELPADTASAANDVRRYWDSKNVDVSASDAGQPYTLGLTKLFSQFDPSVLNDVRDVAASAENVFVASGTSVFWYNAWNTGSLVDDTNLGVAPVILAVSQGDAAMAVDADGYVWYRGNTDLAFTNIYDAAAGAVQGLWFVKGRFVAFRRDLSGTGELGELAPDGTFTLFDTTGEYDVLSVVSTGPSIVAGVTDGTLRSYVPEQANQTDPGSVNLVIRGRTDVPEGEIPSVLGSSGSVLSILTIADDPVSGVTTRFYSAEALSSQYDYVVGQLQLRREWFGTAEVLDPTANMTPTRDAIFFAITEDDGNTYTWRFDLVTLGLSRHSTALEGAVGHAITMFDGRGAVVSADDGFLYLASESYHAEGYLISPNITFGLNTDIAWIATVLEAFNISDLETQVELWRSTDPEAILDPDHISWVHVSRLSNSSQSGVELPMLGVSSRTLALQVKLTSKNGTHSPQVTRTAVRGFPTHRDWVVHLPVNVSDWVEVPGRMPLHVSGLGDDLQSQMLNLVGKHVELIVLDPPLLFRGVVDNVDQPVTFLSERGSVSVSSMLQFRGLRATSTIFPVGDAGLGIGLLGVATMGVEQTDIGGI